MSRFNYCFFSVFAARDGIEMVIRGCSLESLDSQCGDFKYQDVRYKGCVTSCDLDGCNSANSIKSNMPSFVTIVLLNLIFYGIFNKHIL